MEGAVLSALAPVEEVELPVTVAAVPEAQTDGEPPSVVGNTKERKKQSHTEGKQQETNTHTKVPL